MLEHHEAGSHLVERRHARAAHLVGLPRRRDLTLQLRQRVLLLRWCQIRPIAKREDLRNPVVFLQERATDDLGGMSREYQLDPQRADSGHQRLPRNACAEQSRECLCARPALRVPMRVACMIAPAMHTVVLFGDIRER